MRKYLGKIAEGFTYHIKGNIPSKKIDNAIKTFASGIDRTSIIGFLTPQYWGVERMAIFSQMIRFIT